MYLWLSFLTLVGSEQRIKIHSKTIQEDFVLKQGLECSVVMRKSGF